MLIGAQRSLLRSPAAAASAYTGPGDIVSFAFWGGFRAYSAATAGTKAIRVVRASDSAQTDINTLANGALDEATLATFLTSTTGKLVTIYDKVSTNDITMPTDARRPDITLNALGSSSGATFVAATQQYLAGSTFTQSQPYALVALFKPTAAVTGDIFGISHGSYLGGFFSYTAGGNIRIYAGTIADVAMTQAFHAFQAVFNGASSISAQDGSESTVNAGTAALSTSLMGLGHATPDPYGTFIGMEFGYVAGTISGGNRTSLNSNMHAAYGAW